MSDDNIFYIEDEEMNQHDKSQKKEKVEPIKPIQSVKPLSINEMIENKPVPKEYALYPILPIQGIMFIYAATGIGKTMFSLNIAYSIASGGEFLKYSSPIPRRVLYIDAEMSYIDIYTRLTEIIKQQGDLDFPDKFLLYTPDKFIPTNFTQPIRMPKIDDSDGQAFYTSSIEANDIDVIVIDNLSMLSIIDENKSDQWHLIQDWLLSLRAKGKTVIIVHHAGKDKAGYRGTSRMLDAVDTAISLQEIDEMSLDTNSSHEKRFKIVYQKHRSFYGTDALSYEVTCSNNIWSYRSIELSVIDKIIESLNANMTQREIAKDLFISQPTVNRLIKKARLTGRIK
jgi:RecA-family ATPase